LDGASAPDEWIGLAEVVSTRNAPRLIEALRASRDYQVQDKPTAAGEECFHALSAAPYFLPLHARLAEVFVQQRRIDDAIAKYMAMAAVQRARGDMAKMANTLGRVLTYAPDNIEVRESLIELLVSRGEIAEAIDQYLALGAVHMRLAQLDRAQKAYESALWLVPKSGIKDRWTLTTLHMLGEIFVQRAAWKEALPVYLQIRKLAPDDDKASLRLIDLYFKLGRQPETENELAHLIRLYERRGDETKLIPMIGDMVAVRPRNSVLRNHLVDLLLRSGDKERAIGELDALGELQLSGRQTRDAIQTIERIIALEPPNLDSYRTLLAQLQSDA
jgi:tetratricopeptide (TPR) repeat protein